MKPSACLQINRWPAGREFAVRRMRHRRFSNGAPPSALDRTSAAAGRTVFLATIVLAVIACSKEPTGPAQRPLAVAAVDGNAQFGLARATLELPLTVQVTDAGTGAPVKEVTVTWRVTAGTGASVATTAAATDDTGMASARLTLGTDTGTYRVEASAPRLVGNPAAFEAVAILQPTIQAITPTAAAAGSTVVITGANFRTRPADNTVLFGNWRGRVVAATATQLTAEVPRCALTRDVPVSVALGSVRTTALTIRTLAGSVSALALARGQARTFTEVADLECIAFTGAPAGAEYLLVAQNQTQRIGFPFRTELNAIIGGSIATAFTAASNVMIHRHASDWELLLREHERAFSGPPGDADAITSAAAPVATNPRIGDRRTFNVLTRDLKSRSATAEVRAITSRAVIYVDLQAPANGLTDADLIRFGNMFDDPIYSTVGSVFGSPSDVDGNGLIIVLFTPAVNELTDRNASGFIAGYFYGCDLVAETRCKDTNRSEILYSMVPDPTGQFSGSRTKDTVLRTVPGVLAHELQHMIHFSRRGSSLDLLWVAEGLAHAAEDVVGDVFLARGDAASANDFRRPNYVRTQFYLTETAGTALVGEQAPGSLELRGGAWLFMKYLMGHYGGTTLLGRLTGMTGNGVPNIVAATERTWSALLAEFAVAIWADDAPELATTSIDARYRFPNIDLRATMGTIPGGYTLRVVTSPFSDFQWSGSIASGGQAYVMLRGPATPPPPFHVALTSLRGAPFPAGAPVQLTVLRVR